MPWCFVCLGCGKCPRSREHEAELAAGRVRLGQRGEAKGLARETKGNEGDMCFRPAAVSADRSCPECGTTVEGSADICPNCGAEVPSGAMAPGAPGMPAAPGAPGTPAAPGTPNVPAPGQRA